MTVKPVILFAASILSLYFITTTNIYPGVSQCTSCFLGDKVKAEKGKPPICNYDVKAFRHPSHIYWSLIGIVIAGSVGTAIGAPILPVERQLCYKCTTQVYYFAYPSDYVWYCYRCDNYYKQEQVRVEYGR